MIASLLELNHGLAAVAPLPSLAPGLLQELIGLLVAGALARVVPLAIAGTADLGLAAGAFAIAAAVAVAADVLGSNPLLAPGRGAI